MNKPYTVVLNTEDVELIREKVKYINLSALIRDLLKEYIEDLPK